MMMMSLKHCIAIINHHLKRFKAMRAGSLCAWTISDHQRTRAPLPSTLPPRTAVSHHDQGASGKSSLASLLSAAASSSISCGDASVPAFHATLSTVKAE